MLAVSLLVGCAGTEERAVVCGVGNQDGPPPPHLTTCGEAESSYDRKRGCPIDEAGAEEVYFVNDIREWTQTVKLQVLVDGEEVFVSTDPLLLERDIFPIARLGAGDHEVTTVIEMSGRSGPLCDYRHEVKAAYRREAGEGPLRLVLYSKRDEPLEESISVRWEELSPPSK
jgi:hypothetical protein